MLSDKLEVQSSIKLVLYCGGKPEVIEQGKRIGNLSNENVARKVCDKMVTFTWGGHVHPLTPI